jgi:uncharacterized protein YbjT (DUF2867 family)
MDNMHVVMGATGHVGRAVVDALSDAGENVTAIVHQASHAGDLQHKGIAIVEADVHDVDALRAAFRRGRRAFLLNSPAATSTDTDREEHATARAIVAALDGSGLEKVVVESAYGAQPGERIGDLSVLYDLEQALLNQPIPVTIQRAAYYMSNWDAVLDAAKGGTLPTMFPADLKIPMVAPADLGRAAAQRLRELPRVEEPHYVEGPERYSANDVAAAFAAALGKAVTVQATPRDRWVEAYRALGFSDAAADSYARMTAVSVDDGFDTPAAPERGETTLAAYVNTLVAEADGRAHD